MQPNHLQTQHKLRDVFTEVYVLIDDYLKVSQKTGRISLPRAAWNQKASYAELMSIAIVGELQQQANLGLWYELVKHEYSDLFPRLPDITRYYRILKNLERIFADLALSISSNQTSILVIDSKPVPIGSRYSRRRKMVEASRGWSSLGPVFGFKLHALVQTNGLISRFAVVPANEADVTVARSLLQGYTGCVLGDKAYVGSQVNTPPKENSLTPWPWTSLMNRARKTVESVFSSLVRTKHLGLAQLNSFWSIRAAIARKIAAHNLAWFLNN